MAKIIFLGTSSSIPTKTRDNTSFLFSHNKQSLLIDCPGSITQKLLKVGFDFRKLQKVIITHHHPDHIYGIISLIHTQAYLNKKIKIYSNKPSLVLIKKLITLFRLNKPQFPQIENIDVFSQKYFMRTSGLTLEAIPNKHAQGSFGIKFSFQKKAILYSSDTAFCPSMLKDYGHFHYVIHDCTASYSYFLQHPQLFKMHTNSVTLAQYMRTMPKTKLIPVHFLLLRKGEEKRIRKELAPFHKQTIFVKDFQTVILR
jgi:ribonuclease BN (tRNA processing enzyme)